MNRLSGALRSRRVTAVAALLVLQYFAAEWVVSATWRGEYGYRDDYVGPLGLPFCGPQGNWPCSALYPVMNVSFVLTGAAICFVACAWIAQRVVATAHGTLLAIAGVALTLVGLVTERTDYPLHSTAMHVFFVLGTLSILLIAVSATTRMASGPRSFATAAGLVGIVAYFAYVAGYTGWLGSGGTERVIVYSVLVSVVVLGVGGNRAVAAKPPDVDKHEVAV